MIKFDLQILSEDSIAIHKIFRPSQDLDITSYDIYARRRYFCVYIRYDPEVRCLDFMYTHKIRSQGLIYIYKTVKKTTSHK